ncbi:MAG TPA: hypothetical protein VH442_01480 [Micromonosporaceae bacterium]
MNRRLARPLTATSTPSTSLVRVPRGAGAAVRVARPSVVRRVRPTV